mgnify:CR=1 FL=1
MPAGVEPVAVFIVSGVALGGLAWAIGVGTESVGAHFGPDCKAERAGRQGRASHARPTRGRTA